jgi:hypothetical protein
MLSTMHAIFCGLQEHLHSILRELPNSIDPSIRQGLLNAHEKLSDYYYKYDKSPFYTWAACECSLSLQQWHIWKLELFDPVLDPWISYEGIKEDYNDDPLLWEYLESAKQDLHNYYHTHYANSTWSSRPLVPETSVSNVQGSLQKVNFTAQYC